MDTALGEGDVLVEIDSPEVDDEVAHLFGYVTLSLSGSHFLRNGQTDTRVWADAFGFVTFINTTNDFFTNVRNNS